MERKILAELFVEDDCAIDEDLGTIDYTKAAIDRRCADRGISTGDMRILDDDDPEDAKAIALADKIFSSEENELSFVYVVTTNIITDCSTDTTIQVFSTYEKAKAYFDECVANTKANNSLMMLDNKVVYESDDCFSRNNHFSVYQEGYWSEDRYEISIDERMVH